MSNYNNQYKVLYDELMDIASVGKDNFLEFYLFLNEVIDDSEFSIFEDIIDNEFNMNIRNLNPVSSYRNLLWEKIVFETRPLLSTYLSKIYKLNSLYQNSTYLSRDKIILLETENSNKIIDELVEIKFYDKRDRPYEDINYDFDRHILTSSANLDIIKYDLINKDDDKIISSGIIHNTSVVNKLKIQLINPIRKIKDDGKFIYYYEMNDIIGELIEDYKLEEDDFIYYIKNGQYARLIGELKDILVCSKIYNKNILYTNIIPNEEYDLEFEDNIILDKIKIKDNENKFLEENKDYIIKDNNIIFNKSFNFINTHIDYRKINLQEIFNISKDDTFELFHNSDLISNVTSRSIDKIIILEKNKDYELSSNHITILNEKLTNIYIKYEYQKVFSTTSTFTDNGKDIYDVYDDGLKYLLNDIEINTEPDDIIVIKKKDPFRDGGYFSKSKYNK